MSMMRKKCSFKPHSYKLAHIYPFPHFFIHFYLYIGPTMHVVFNDTDKRKISRIYIIAGIFITYSLSKKQPYLKQ
jgi:hypothetical protein